jgi:hypothetical protein
MRHTHTHTHSYFLESLCTTTNILQIVFLDDLSTLAVVEGKRVTTV